MMSADCMEELPKNYLREKELEEHFRSIIKLIEPDTWDRPELDDTPRRVAKAYTEFFRGYEELPFNMTDFTSGYGGMVVRSAIPFVAHCEHHICPFEGTIDFAYIPDGKILGLSKIIRFMQHYSSRLWTQEDMTDFLIDEFCSLVEPAGAAIIVQACHSCEGHRGVKTPNVPTITAAVRGLFSTDKLLEEKFYQLANRGRSNV